MAEKNHAVRDEKVKRGQTIRTATTRDRGDDKMGYEDTLHHDMGGSDDDLSHSLTGGAKVASDE